MREEHGEYTHGYFIYQGALRVPLIFKLPHRTRPGKTSELAGLIDIVPTVCSLLGLEVPERVQGIDLSPYFGQKEPAGPDRELYCESLTPTKYEAAPLLGVVTDRYKYVYTTRPELYDLSLDPKEKKNLVTQLP